MHPAEGGHSVVYIARNRMGLPLPPFLPTQEDLSAGPGGVCGAEPHGCAPSFLHPFFPRAGEREREGG